MILADRLFAFLLAVSCPVLLPPPNGRIILNFVDHLVIKMGTFSPLNTGHNGESTVSLLTPLPVISWPRRSIPRRLSVMRTNQLLRLMDNQRQSGRVNSRELSVGRTEQHAD